MTPAETLQAAETRAYGLRRAYLFGDGTREAWRDAADEARRLRDALDVRPALKLVTTTRNGA